MYVVVRYQLGNHRGLQLRVQRSRTHTGRWRFFCPHPLDGGGQMTPLLSKSTTHLQLRLPEGGAFKVVNIMTGKTVALVTAETPVELGLVFQAFNELFRA